MTLLSVRNLTKSFGGLAAVKDLSFDCREGSITGLIGPNGAGKTTAFNLVSGFYKPDGGSIRFAGEDVTGLRPDKICKKGLVRTFQIVKPFQKLSVLENVAVGALIRTNNVEEAKREAEGVLEFIGMAAKKDLVCKELTVADRKLLELGRALATKPKLMLLDEVVAGLNPTEVLSALDVIREIRDSGITLLIVEHVMKAIMSVCDTVVVMHYGTKIAEGRPKVIASDETVIKAYLGEEYSLA